MNLLSIQSSGKAKKLENYNRSFQPSAISSQLSGPSIKAWILEVHGITIIHVRLLITLVLLVAPVLASAQDRCAENEPNFSAQARSFWHLAFDNQTRRVPSPDGKKVVVLRVVGRPLEDNVALDLTVGTKRFTNLLSGFSSVEVLWSPDSHYVAITTTGEGSDMLGTELVVLAVESESVREIPVHKSLLKAFPRRLGCEDVFMITSAITWKNNETLIASVGPPWCSVCKQMATFDAFEVNLPGGTIGRHYPQVQAKQDFRGKLGCLLRLANDGDYRPTVKNRGRRSQAK